MPDTLFDKIWKSHTVAELPSGETLLYIDRHLVHEVTSPQAFDGLRLAGRSVRRPDLTFATADHNVPTDANRLDIADLLSRQQIETLKRNCEEFGIPYYGLTSPYQGIVHIIGPELGLTQQDVSGSVLVSLSSTSQVAPNFWVNPQNRVNYRVAVQTPEYRIHSIDTLMNTPIINGQTLAANFRVLRAPVRSDGVLVAFDGARS